MNSMVSDDTKAIAYALEAIRLELRSQSRVYGGRGTVEELEEEADRLGAAALDLCAIDVESKSVLDE